MPGIVGYFTAILHRAAMPSSWIIRRELEGSVDNLDMASPMHLKMTGSGSDERLCAACTLLLDTISTRQDLEAERFCRMTAHTRRVRVSDPFDNVPSTDITPMSEMRGKRRVGEESRRGVQCHAWHIMAV